MCDPNLSPPQMSWKYGCPNIGNHTCECQSDDVIIKLMIYVDQ